jgi:hypothetical protein
MTTVDYQVIIDVIASTSLVAIPIAIAIALSEKFINLFVGFVHGGKVNL